MEASVLSAVLGSGAGTNVLAGVLFALVIWLLRERKEQDERRDSIARDAVATNIRLAESLTKLTVLVEQISQEVRR